MNWLVFCREKEKQIFKKNRRINRLELKSMIRERNRGLFCLNVGMPI